MLRFQLLHNLSMEVLNLLKNRVLIELGNYSANVTKQHPRVCDYFCYYHD